MVELSTDDAFRLLVNNQYRWNKMGGNESTRRSLLTRIKQGKEITMDTKVKYLKMAGFRLKSYPRWSTPKFR
jgi:hypothetical protein